MLVRAADYFVDPLIETKQVAVTIALKRGEESKEFRMPAWAPGDYQLFNYGTKIQDVSFTKAGRRVIASRSSDPNLWLIPDGADRVTYVVNESGGNFSPNLRVTPGEIFISGPGVFGWFKDHAEEPHLLSLPGERQMIAVALPERNTIEGYVGFAAKTYDQLIDSPIVISDRLRRKTFLVGGAEHQIVAYNKAAQADLDSYQVVATKAVEEAIKMFGRVPYSKYLFMFDFGGGGGGLEHMDSSRMVAYSNDGSRLAGLIFHEYLHAYNVKRIRSRPLGPFDYTKPAVTEALWWLEGVTDYYASVMIHRSGLTNRQQFLRSMAGTLNSIRKNPRRLSVSAADMSRRVWEVKGSQGYQMSYYQKGKAVGVLLDLAIRSESGNAHSLDDVMVALYRECLNGPGFEESRIRELCLAYGGTNLGSIYDQCVNEAKNMPIESVMAAAGLRWTGSGIAEVDAASQAKVQVRDAWPYQLKSP